MGYISTDAALWAAAGVFIVAAGSRITGFTFDAASMINRVNENAGES